MNWILWILWILGGYVAIGLIIAIVSLFLGNTVREALHTIYQWPLHLVFILGMLGR